MQFPGLFYFPSQVILLIKEFINLLQFLWCVFHPFLLLLMTKNTKMSCLLAPFTKLIFIFSAILYATILIVYIFNFNIEILSIVLLCLLHVTTCPTLSLSLAQIFIFLLLLDHKLDLCSSFLYCVSNQSSAAHYRIE